MTYLIDLHRITTTFFLSNDLGQLKIAKSGRYVEKLVCLQTINLNKN